MEPVLGKEVEVTVEIGDERKNMTRDELLTPDEVAAFLRIPKATLYRWRYHGQGPKAVRVGRHLRYPVSDLLAWLSRSEEDPE